MKYTNIILAIAFTSGLAGCATQPAPQFTPLAFNEAEYAALPKTGTGVVRGQAFGKTVGGDVKKGAGESVAIWPATSYGTQRYEEQVLRGNLSSVSEDPRYSNYVLVKTTDGDGKFEFVNVPPGTYYVVSKVTWSVVRATSFGPITNLQGGVVAKKIDVKDGAVTDAMLTLN